MRHVCGKPEAIAFLRGGGEAPRLRGTVKFYPDEVGTLVEARVYGLPENDTGFFAFHIHEGNNCGGTDFSGSGAHFNPTHQPHPRHAGDLPPLLFREGQAFLAVKTGRFTPGQVVGRTVIIHENADDFHTQSAGNPGKKIACGKIQWCSYENFSQKNGNLTKNFPSSSFCGCKITDNGV